ncbi:hypothetical protein L6164_019691 [Bauhinia variegata]|uniref:Uncharacterized protein n=1 Tax=Bauhinia variegata TaxID=167791 RepID=A0ACB9MSY8_BAUVA|nr:hypothetical protein L6164_019691 [Bauhinia variegata]
MNYGFVVQRDYATLPCRSAFERVYKKLKYQCAFLLKEYYITLNIYIYILCPSGGWFSWADSVTRFYSQKTFGDLLEVSGFKVLVETGFCSWVGMEERYEPLKELGSGNFGVARLVRDKKSRELVAVKYIERGKKIDENVQREIINHRSLRHPNIIKFKEVLLTPTHLAIVMEYAAGGELFDRICSAGRFSEDEARFFFQQLISGVSYCHSMQICHRDLKLENTLLDGSPTPRLKICDFGYSKSALLHSQPKSTVGTPAYIAPEVLSRKEYDGKIADVWSCGVTLYVMLVGAYPFEDPEDPRNFRKSISRIMSVQYSIPDYVRVSADCRNLLSQIFVADPAKRITISKIKEHPWFLKNLAREIVEAEKKSYEEGQKLEQPSQSVEEVLRIIQEARTPGQASKDGDQSTGSGILDGEDVDESEIDVSGDYAV